MDFSAEYTSLLNQLDSLITSQPWASFFIQSYPGTVSGNKGIFASRPNLVLILANIFGLAVSDGLARILAASEQ